MTVSLRSALGETLDGWKTDLSPAWGQVLAGVEPDIDAVDAALTVEAWEPIFPARKRQPDDTAN